MTLSRRSLVKLGLQAGALPLLDLAPLRAAAAEAPASTGAMADDATTSRGAVRPVLQAQPLPLESVRLTGGPLKRAQDADREYLLQLEPDRMLAYFRKRAGLAPKAEPYGGWDGDGRNLTGHVAGHHLSAISLMWAATGDARFRDRAHYMVRELKTVQDRQGDGYLVALQNGRRCFGMLQRGEVHSSAFDLNGEWSPWYTLHKMFAGLRDAYRYTGDRNALLVETRFAGWAEGVLAPLSDAQIQQMLGTEFGGMNEVLADLYADTGDRRWLDLSYRFEHRAFVAPLERHEDDLGNKHANTNIPKIIGSAARYTYTGRPADLLASSFFWDRVVQHHGFSTGGHGTDEFWGPADVIGARVDGRTAESCNVYNMLKLSRTLFSLWPDAHYADYHERALYNHALASFDTDAGRMCYMVPVGRAVTHEYQDMKNGFTCCVCTGMENHALHGYGLYYESADRLWINQYAPSVAEWKSAGARLTMDTSFPEGEAATLTLALREPRELTLAVRRPYWAGDGFAVKVNGMAVTPPAAVAQAGSTTGTPHRDPYAWPAPVGSYVEVKRTWHSGDVVEVTLPKTLRLEPTPDEPRRAAIMWGPLVLAGDLGPVPSAQHDEDGGDEVADDPTRSPVLVAADRPLDEWIVPAAGGPGHFRTNGVGREPNAAGPLHDVDLVPFHELHQRTYSTYWDLRTPAEWASDQAAYQREAERQKRLDAATVGFVRPGDASSEREFHYQGGADVHPARVEGRTGRAGRSWFSYDLPVDATHPTAIVATYYTADRRSTPAVFDILVDGEKIGEQKLERTDPARFFDVQYAVPPALVRGKRVVTVRFEAAEKSQIGAVFGVRVVREDEAP